MTDREKQIIVNCIHEWLFAISIMLPISAGVFLTAAAIIFHFS